MNENIIRDKLAYYANMTYDRGLVTAAGGNISYRLGKNEFLVSPTNCCLGNIKPDEFIIVDSNYKVMQGDTLPSKETKMHMTVYSLRENVDCILHTHSPYATAYSINNVSIPLVTASARLKLLDTPLISYADPGSDKLSRLVHDKVKSVINPEINCFLLQAHGVLCFSSSTETCFNLAELCEDTAKIAYLSRNFAPGFNPGKIHDLSQTVYTGMPKYPLDPDVIIEPFRTFENDGFNLLKIVSGLHAGTHIDAPKHQQIDGIGIDQVSVKSCMGNAQVFEVFKESNAPIEISDIDPGLLKENQIILFSTTWEKYAGTENYYDNPPYISKELTELLIYKKIKAIGVDMPSVDSFTGTKPVSHRLFLKNDIPVIEGLVNLKTLINKNIYFIGLPIKIENGDGSPIRAIAFEV